LVMTKDNELLVPLQHVLDVVLNCLQLRLHQKFPYQFV
jgi:hypothetical protein